MWIRKYKHIRKYLILKRLACNMGNEEYNSSHVTFKSWCGSRQNAFK